METQVTRTIERITLHLSRGEAAKALVDPKELQLALREALGDEDEAENASGAATMR